MSDIPGDISLGDAAASLASGESESTAAGVDISHTGIGLDDPVLYNKETNTIYRTPAEAGKDVGTTGKLKWTTPWRASRTTKER